MREHTTLPSELDICLLLNWGTDENNEKIKRVILSVLEKIGCNIDITNLSGITIASDYAQGLSSIDRGQGGLAPLDYTKTGDAQGRAKAVLVKRENKLMSHLIFRDEIIAPTDSNPGSSVDTLYTIAHECAHVDVHSFIDTKLPNFLLTPRNNSYEKSIVLDFSLSVLMEYFACRKSARYGEYIVFDSLYLTTRYSLDGTLLKIKNEVFKYRVHADIDKLVKNVYKHIWVIMNCFARLIGHIDGLGVQYDLNSNFSNSEEELFFEKYVLEMQTYLRSLWDSPDSWIDISLFDPLNSICKQIFYDLGIQFTTLPEGQTYILVP